jgi:hypothetical protein
MKLGRPDGETSSRYMDSLGSEPLDHLATNL